MILRSTQQRPEPRLPCPGALLRLYKQQVQAGPDLKSWVLSLASFLPATRRRVGESEPPDYWQEEGADLTAFQLGLWWRPQPSQILRRHRQISFLCVCQAKACPFLLSLGHLPQRTPAPSLLLHSFPPIFLPLLRKRGQGSPQRRCQRSRGVWLLHCLTCPRFCFVSPMETELCWMLWGL